nr:hypothetical protein [Tanacetum cinerariifolium]
DTSKNTKFVKQPIVDNSPKVGKTNALSNPVTSNSVSTPQESKSVNNDKPKKVGTRESLATPKPRKSRLLFRWSPTGRLFNQEGKIVDSSVLLTLWNLKSNGFQILPLCLTGLFCDSDFEVAFRRNACFVRNLERVDLLKGDRSTNLYIINLNEMASASPIYLMARLPKFKYHKEHLCPSCEQGKRKRASHPPKPVLNSRQRLHLLHMDLCGPMRIASINGKHALCYPKNDREDIGKLGAKGDIGFFIGYSADSCAYRIYNRRTKKIIETMNVSFDELSAMAFE